MLTAGLSVLLCLLGVLGLHGGLGVRAGADVAGGAALAVYLCSPAVFRQWGEA